LKVTKTVKPATPWNVSLAKLTNLEKTIVASEGEALKARWSFGRELVSRRVDYKGQLVIPHDLMALTMETCKLSRREINYRVRFALRYPDKNLCSDAISTYPSWYQMTHDGLVEQKRGAPQKKQSAPTLRSGLRRLDKELERAAARHEELTRDDVAAIERIHALLVRLLAQIDQNDKAKAS
jgi:hypothetical protein